MKTLTKIITALALVASMNATHAGENKNPWTPDNIYEGYVFSAFYDDSTKEAYTAYVMGVTSTIMVTQEFGITGKNICLPKDLKYADYQLAIALIDSEDFDDTESGGVVFIYTALFEKFRCK